MKKMIEQPCENENKILFETLFELENMKTHLTKVETHFIT